MNYQNLRNLAKQEGSKGYVLDMLCSTANHIALENNVELFCVLTQTGRIARYLAKQRPVQRIMACSTNPQIVR
jgi:pyruvate kinase